MIYGWLFIIAAVTGVACFLFIPFTFAIRVEKNRYSAELKQLVHLRIASGGQGRRIGLRIPLANVTLNRTKRQSDRAARTSQSRKPTSTSERKAGWSRRRSRIAKAAPLLLRDFFNNLHIKRLYLALDTGDYALNARLFSLKALTGARGITLDINFNNRNCLHLVISGMLASLLPALLRFGWRIL